MKRWHGTLILIYRSISRPESLPLWISSKKMTQLTWTFVGKKMQCVTCQEIARVVAHVRTGVPGTEAVASLA